VGEIDLEKQIQLYEETEKNINDLIEVKNEYEKILINVKKLIEDNGMGEKYSNLKNKILEVQNDYEEKNELLNDLKSKSELIENINKKIIKTKEQQREIEESKYNLQKEYEFTKKLQGFSFKTFGASVLVFVGVIFYNNFYENSFKNITNFYLQKHENENIAILEKLEKNENNINKIIEYINKNNKK
jgi:hypothetical protein